MSPDFLYIWDLEYEKDAIKVFIFHKTAIAEHIQTEDTHFIEKLQ